MRIKKNHNRSLTRVWSKTIGFVKPFAIKKRDKITTIKMKNVIEELEQDTINRL